MTSGSVHRRRPRILVLAMYELGAARSGPEVRIARMLAALRELADVDIVAAHRPGRRIALARYAAAGHLRGLGGIYVESSTALPSETDIAFLGLARSLGVPVLSYVRDAYQLFPDYYAADTLRRRASRALFPWAMRALGAVSTRLAFPSRGLADAVLGPDAANAVLLPPGAPAPVQVSPDAGASRLLFVGDTHIPAQGGAAMLEGIALARDAGTDIGLICVCRPGGEPPLPHPDWLRVERATSDEIASLLPQVIATVIPRRAGTYNDLALPIKLMEYLAYGRPLIVTDRHETAAMVRAAGAGIVCGDAPAEIATAIREVATAPAATRDAWSAGARDAARENSWGRRAEQVLDALGVS